MEGFIKCSNNHFYKEHLPACPYCPSQGAGVSSDLGRTSATDSTRAGHTSHDLDKTRVGGATNSTENTLKVDVPTDTRSTVETKDFNRTFIATPTEIIDGAKVVSSRPTRKLVGWLISYTIDSMGVDFRIFEGNNSIGRSSENSIVIPQDATISNHHATILYKESQGFFIKDEMSANGTFLNGEELSITTPVSLKDGDLLKMAKTVFRFKTAL